MTLSYLDMSSDIVLKRPGYQEDNTLPHGVKAIVVGGRIVFVRMNKYLKNWVQVSQQEQERLTTKHVRE